MSDVVVGEDGLARCPWGESSDEMRTYHDTEWGRPVRDERGLFERLTLEAFQSGLSWAIVLRKRPRFREVFAGFDAEVVAAYDGARVTELLEDAGIIRTRLKIEATIANAAAVRALDGGFADLVWSFAPPARPRPASFSDVPAVTPESKALAAALKRHGFVFVGPTTAYALMQATGMVDDHLAGCHVRTDVD
ncbi:DNA-3-methyladenine glycosylase I [Mumia zhuanghuii]|uniref:DNA-3-methyladenine glycosylase I n=1 Tax=Mumia zhuanghuii TaxID=2585211 RepID=A0A5C4MFC9_9ACTN|nr:DNA-3-methyladenine glycosylase I [Mumia zhuanghuii]TNC33229.1 DNA-3-methyladenine glycosylase I [Mumia zhuanghuii]